ncbi:VOC family protein [Nocardia brasiliensis]|uniref:VOC family protein n=1 Tax=Nocardia brasiliensis TaxID=37326 RepID=UPI002458D36E|nr:VOC family protein [Nocardia brasiliensis]
MKLSSFYPVIGTTDIAAARDFYTTWLGFEITFEADWYVSLRRAGDRTYELALLDYTHPTVPAARAASPGARDGPRTARETRAVVTLSAPEVAAPG